MEDRVWATSWGCLSESLMHSDYQALNKAMMTSRQKGWQRVRRASDPEREWAVCLRVLEAKQWRSYLCGTVVTVEKAVAPHSSTLAWRIPWTEEPGRLQSMGSLRVGLDWTTSVSLFTFTHWRRKWQPTPVFLPGESQGRGSLVGCRLWGHTELDTTEVT